MGVLASDAADPHAGTLNPIQLSGGASCPTTDVAVADGNIAMDSEPLTEAFDMLGLPQVTFEAVPSEVDMYVAMRLWDVDPEAETQILVTRGVYQLGASVPQEVSSQLFGNGWTFPSGHVIRIELTANDAPTFLAPSSDTGTIAIADVTLSVPHPNGDPVATKAVPARVLRTIGRVKFDF
jgi:Predicted acyl esterases